MLAFRRNAGLRIDLILASHALAQKCGACHIDKAPRKLERPSDHAPVVASLTYKPPANANDPVSVFLTLVFPRASD